MPLLVQLNPHEELSFQQSPGGGELVARIGVRNIAGRPIAYKVRKKLLLTLVIAQSLAAS